MSIAWLAPLGLGALAALLVPIAIHLRRRAEHRSTPFAALRFLRPGGLPRRRIRLAEPGLLALRCALLAVVAGMLAQPLLERTAAPRHVVAVVPPLAAAAARAHVEIGPDTDEVWLAPGFPPLSTTAPDPVQPTASLLRELDATLPAGSRLDVVVPERLAGLDAERPRLSRAIGWHVVAGAAPARNAPPVALPRHIVVRASPDAPARRHLAAAVASWRADGETADLVEYVPGAALATGATLVWLDAPLDDDARRMLERGGTALVANDAGETGRVLANSPDGTPLVRERAIGRGRLVAIAPPFSPATLPAMHEADFPRLLASWIDPLPAAPDVALAEAIEPLRGGGAPSPGGEPLAPWLALIAALLFAIERTWAGALDRRRAA